MEAHSCLMRFLTNLARLCASKSANGPRKNSFRPDSPHDNLQPGTEDSAIPLTTPDMVRSGRVLPTSVKSPSENLEKIHINILSAFTVDIIFLLYTG